MSDRFRSDEPTFWMNVTTSANWKRSAVGVVRVEQEIKKHLRERLGKRFQPFVLENSKFVVEDERLHGSVADGDFWPDPSFGASADPFDLLQSPSMHGGVGKAPTIPKSPGFQPGDVLVSLGLDWDYEGLHPEIRRLVRIYDLTVITCCYDLIPVLFPQYCVGDVAAWFKNYLIDLTWNSDGVLCISENTRKDYLALCSSIGAPIRRTEVIRLGSSLPTKPVNEEPSTDVSGILRDKFFLFVSTIERRKNHEVLYRAYRLIRNQHPDIDLPKLVFVGMQGWGVADLLSDIRLDPVTKDDIVILSEVTDAELTLLYSNCEAFLYPSLYEGWGLPIAEALQLGRPVIASDVGSIPEVGGDLVRYLDPWAPREWADEILKLATGKADLISWSSRIRDQFEPFEWAAAAEKVISLSRELKREKSKTRVFEAGYDLSTLHALHFGSKIVYSGRRGNVCHGPYIALAEGAYEIKLNTEWIEAAPGFLRLRAVHNDGKTCLATRDIDTRSLTPGIYEFVVWVDVSEQVDDFELVCEARCTDDVKISVDRLQISRMGGAAASVPSKVSRPTPVRRA